MSNNTFILLERTALQIKFIVSPKKSNFTFKTVLLFPICPLFNDLLFFFLRFFKTKHNGKEEESNTVKML